NAIATGNGPGCLRYPSRVAASPGAHRLGGREAIVANAAAHRCAQDRGLEHQVAGHVLQAQVLRLERACPFGLEGLSRLDLRGLWRRLRTGLAHAVDVRRAGHEVAD